MWVCVWLFHRQTNKLNNYFILIYLIREFVCWQDKKKTDWSIELLRNQKSAWRRILFAKILLEIISNMQTILSCSHEIEAVRHTMQDWQTKASGFITGETKGEDGGHVLGGEEMRAHYLMCTQRSAQLDVQCYICLFCLSFNTFLKAIVN